jgi:hypothetical protein
MAICTECAHYLSQGLISDVFEITTGETLVQQKGVPGADHATALLWSAKRFMDKHPNFYPKAPQGN